MCETTHTVPRPPRRQRGPKATRRKAVGRSSGSCFNVEAAGNPRRRGVGLTKWQTRREAGTQNQGARVSSPPGCRRRQTMKGPLRARALGVALSAACAIGLAAAPAAPADPVAGVVLPCLGNSPAPDRVSNPLPCPPATAGSGSNSTSSSQSTNSTNSSSHRKKAKRRGRRHARKHRARHRRATRHRHRRHASPRRHVRRH